MIRSFPSLVTSIFICLSIMPVAAKAFNFNLGFWQPVGGPSLALDFTQGTLPIQVSFNRSAGTNVSPGSYYNSSGTLVTAPMNQLYYSQDMSQSSAWWLGTGAAVVANATTAPDGSNTGDVINVTNAPLYGTGIGQNRGLVSSTSTYTFSVYAKSTSTMCTGNLVQLQFNMAGGTIVAPRACFSLTNGAYLGGCGGTAPASYTSQSVGNGWYRFSITATDNNSGNNALTVYILTSQSQYDTCSMYVWGAQFEKNASPSSYALTGSSQGYGPRFDYNPKTLAMNGLLIEETRANLIPNSSSFAASGWNLNGGALASGHATAPDSTASPSISATGNFQGVWYYLVPATSQTYTTSVYLKNISGGGLIKLGDTNANSCWSGDASVTFDTTTGGFTASGAAIQAKTAQDIGNGWWRVSLTATTVSTACTYAPMLIYSMNGATASENAMWGAQIEVGPSATSYIPTSGTSLTRNADSVSVPSTNWMSSTSGTIFSQFMVPVNTANNAFVFSLSDGANNSVRQYLNSGVKYDQVYSSGTGVYFGNQSGETAGTSQLSALAYGNASFAGTLNSSLAQVQNTGVTPVVLNQTSLGSSAGNFYLDGWMRNFRYYKARMSNSVLQGSSPP